jgi:broad specificity polyphosphatase/5'/3'-nucleotidase SurE
MLKLAVIVVLLAHAVGHVLFLVPSLRLADWAGQTAHSWALTGTVGDTVARGIAAFVWTATIFLFVAGVAALATGQDWWRAATVAGAVMSIAGIVLFWDGIATTSAIFALAFDAIVLVAMLVVEWPSSEAVGV